MENQKKIAPIKSTLVWEKQGNELVERLNIPWTVKIEPEGLVDTAIVQFGENGIVIQITFNTVDLVACDENGNQKTYTIPAFAPSESE